MLVKKDYLLHILNRLRTASAFSAKYNITNPIWASVAVDGVEKKLSLYGRGFHFALEVCLDIDNLPTFVVDFERLRNTLINSADDEIDFSTTGGMLIVKTEKATYKLRMLDFDYSKYKLSPPSEQIKVEGLMDELVFCSSAASTNLMDYTKYGVVITNKGFIYSTDDTAVATSEQSFQGLDTTFLIQLPLVSILLPLGEITSFSLAGEVCFLNLEDNLGVKSCIKTPVLPIEYNPTILQYTKSFTPDVSIEGITTNTIKRLMITTDYDYPTVDILEKNGEHFFRSRSPQKGETLIPITSITGSIDRTVQVSLPQLRKVLRFFDSLSIDLDNLVLFSRKEKRMFAFGLGGRR